MIAEISSSHIKWTGSDYPSGYLKESDLRAYIYPRRWKSIPELPEFFVVISNRTQTKLRFDRLFALKTVYQSRDKRYTLEIT